MVSGFRSWKLLLVLFFLNAFLVKPVFASTSDGTISSGYAWSSRIGWIDFSTSNGNVHVTDSGLSGSAWSDLYGWIKLDPSTSGVENNGEGVLSGSAWGSNIGWIDFSGVNIGSDGVFYGTASGTNVGVVNFSCANCLVETDWRPVSIRSITTPSIVFPIDMVIGVFGNAIVASTAPSVEVQGGVSVSSSVKRKSLKFPAGNRVVGEIEKSISTTPVVHTIISSTKDKPTSSSNDLVHVDKSLQNKTSKLKIFFLKIYLFALESGKYIGSFFGNNPIICKFKDC